MDELAKKTIEDLYAKYASDPYMLSKTHNYVCFQLPTILENMKKSHEERQQRNEHLSLEQDSFIHTFLNSNQYFYVSTTERFFHYDGKRYLVYTEDAILHHVLTTITRERYQLMCRKPQTKVYIMKRIKENSLLKTIPESETIQAVLDALVPAIFGTKSAAKYFLTVIGDNLLKRVGDQVHFITPKSKPFLREIANISQILIGVNPTASFKHKYYEHVYSDCRLMKIHDSISSENVWRPVLHTYGLDLLCVAAHYSHRYESSDAFLLNGSNDDGLSEYAMFLHRNSPQSLVSMFIEEYLQLIRKDRAASFEDEPKKTGKHITWTNMQYLWRRFLLAKHLPGVMFQNTLKTILADTLGDHYQPEQDVFLDVTSKYLPAVQRFMSFWESTIQVTDSAGDEYEVDELATLYKQWCSESGQGYLAMNDTQILDLIRFYYPTVEIDGDKYVANIRSKMWDKTMDIQVVLDILGERADDDAKISLYDAYEFYLQFNATSKYRVCKAYFDKYVRDTMGANLREDKYIVF